MLALAGIEFIFKESIPGDGVTLPAIPFCPGRATDAAHARVSQALVQSLQGKDSQVYFGGLASFSAG